MRPRRSLCVALLAVSLALPGAAARAEINVWFTEPAEGSYVYGLIDLVAAVSYTPGEVVESVEFFVDGNSVGTATEPPFQIKADVGYENIAHRLSVVARTESGSKADDFIVTDVVVVNDTVRIQLQQLYATVSRGNRRVEGLRKADFRVQDEGKRQEIVTFEGGDVPLTSVLLLDCSESMKGPRLQAALDGAAIFLEGMRDLDEASVMLFSDRLLRSTPFTHEKVELEAALSDVQPAGGTSLNDHLFIAIQRLAKRQGRRVVVLFSDGADFLSVLPMKEVFEEARSSPALIYWIHLRGKGEDDIPSYSSAWRNVDGNEEEFKSLRRAVTESGGRVEQLTSSDQIAGAFAGIIAELREQYVLGYYPTQRHNDGGWHKVRVRVNDASLDVRTRGGYFDW